MEPTVTQQQVCAGCVQVLQDNGMTEGYLRPLSYLGEGNMGLLPSDNPVITVVTGWKWGAYLGADALEHGIRCKIASLARHHVNVAFAQGKLVGQYVNSVMAKREVVLAGYDEAILLDTQGFVAEGSGENIFIIAGGELITPPLSAGILPGITRDTVIVLAREAGLCVREERLTRDQLLLADEVFLTGTAAEVTPVREVDNRAIADGVPGPITRRLQQRYFDEVRGTDTTHPEWLTPY
jgi:branched-chain amino acid aminotransferase